MTGEIELHYEWKRVGTRTNAPGTCLYCRAKLGKSRTGRPAEDRGDYADNAFCTLRCGYSFGVIMAKGGKRLIPWPPAAQEGEKK